MMSFSRVEQLPFNDIIVGSYVGHFVSLKLTRKQVLLVQFSKLLNYFPDQLDEAWGGGLDVLGIERFASARYQYEAEVLVEGSDRCWIHRKNEKERWGPNNWVLKDEPNRELGSPFEPYFSCNGGLLSLNQASRILAVDSRYLYQLKLQHLLDEIIIRECLKNLLSPPPLWAKRDEIIKGSINL